VLLGQVFKTRDVLLECGVIDENVDASEFTHHALDGAETESAAGHVAGNENAVTSFLLNGLARGFRILLFAEIECGDIGAFARKEHRYSAADSGIGARDNRNLITQFI